MSLYYYDHCVRILSSMVFFDNLQRHLFKLLETNRGFNQIYSPRLGGLQLVPSLLLSYRAVKCSQPKTVDEITGRLLQNQYHHLYTHSGERKEGRIDAA